MHAIDETTLRDSGTLLLVPVIRATNYPRRLDFFQKTDLLYDISSIVLCLHVKSLGVPFVRLWLIDHVTAAQAVVIPERGIKAEVDLVSEE